MKKLLLGVSLFAIMFVACSKSPYEKVDSFLNNYDKQIESAKTVEEIEEIESKIAAEISTVIDEKTYNELSAADKKKVDDRADKTMEKMAAATEKLLESSND